MLLRLRALRAWFVGGLLASFACSNGASDSPPVTTPASADTRTVSAAGTPVASKQETSKQEPPDESPPEDIVSSEVPRVPASRRPGDGERLNPKIAGLGTEPMLAAFPERVGAWTRSTSNAHPAGTMGRWADGASASYQQDGREIRVDVSDMIRVSPCTTGTWNAIRDESLAAYPKSKRVMLGKHPAVLAPGSPGADIGLWLGNRCPVGLSTTDATGDELVALGSGLGLDALAVACERRDPADVLLPASP